MKQKIKNSFKKFRGRSRFFQGIAVGLGMTSFASLATVTMNSFSSSSVISSSLVNSNFNLLASAINGLSTSVATNQLNLTNGGTISLMAPTSSTYSLTLPTNVGGANQFLQTDGAGNTTWANAGGGGIAASGGTMTGYLNLSADPVSPLQAATKQYSDSKVAGQPYSGGVPSVNQFLRFNGSLWAPFTMTPDPTVFVNGGNNFGGTARLGTSLSNDLIFETNSTDRMIVDATGRVGIGTLTPTGLLDTVGSLFASSGV